jgi:hypothetical protein
MANAREDDAGHLDASQGHLDGFEVILPLDVQQRVVPLAPQKDFARQSAQKLFEANDSPG